MKTLYLDDPNGLKPPKLSSLEVNNPEELAKNCIDFICQHLINVSSDKTFFSQNISTHVAHLSNIIKNKNPKIEKVYISDHEIRWVKEMLEIPEYEPDSTHSNYRDNDLVNSTTFSVELLKFKDFPETVKKLKDPSIFYISHVSRLTGEIADIESIFKTIKNNNPDSIFIVDGAQTLGAFAPININKVCDVYLSDSLKFLGAEPNVGMAFISDSFFEKYVGYPENYPKFNVELYSRDLFSLWENLNNPLYLSDYNSYIKSLKKYAVDNIKKIDEKILFNPDNQAPNFLTLNFGSVEKNQNFVVHAKENGITLSDNSNLKWSLIDPPVPLIRIGMTVRIREEDVDYLIEVIQKEASRV